MYEMQCYEYNLINQCNECIVVNEYNGWSLMRWMWKICALHSRGQEWIKEDYIYFDFGCNWQCGDIDIGAIDIFWPRLWIPRNCL